MQDNVNVVLIGLSNYGTGYAQALIEQEDNKSVKLVAVVDPFAEKNPYFQTIKSLNIPHYNTFSEYIKATGKDREKAQLAVIASPIHLHVPQTCEALRAEINVLCEKPVCGAVQDALKMIAERDKAKKFVAIGYNWSFYDEILQMKKDFMDGKLGKVLKMKAMVLSPRSLAYYGRNNWAGKISSNKKEWILDSPVNNANSHLLHNMFFITGKSWSSSAKPISVRAELFKANDIENYDTAVMECMMDNRSKVLFVTSHATEKYHRFSMEFEFEKGKIVYTGQEFEMYWKDGNVTKYGTLDNSKHIANKLWNCVDAVQNRKKPYCGIEAALSQTIAMNAAQESPAQIIKFPAPYIKTREELAPDGTKYVYIYSEGLDESLIKCYEEWKMPSELGFEWAIPSRWIECKDYKKFPSSKHFAK